VKGNAPPLTTYVIVAIFKRLVDCVEGRRVGRCIGRREGGQKGGEAGKPADHARRNWVDGLPQGESKSVLTPARYKREEENQDAACAVMVVRRAVASKPYEPGVE
jgi:hypothetical protein